MRLKPKSSPSAITKPKSANFTGPRPNARYGAVGNFPGVKLADARKLVQAEIQPELNALKWEKQKARKEARIDRRRAKRQYNSAVGDINHIFSETGDYINYQNQAIDNNYKALTDRSEQATQALIEHLGQSGSAVANQVDSEMARLGINSGSVMGQFAADQANMEQLARVTGANNQANINQAQSAASDVGALLSGMNAGSRGMALGQTLNAKNNSLFETEENKRKTLAEMTTALRDLRASRPGLTRQVLEQMLQTRWGQYMDQASLNLQRQQLASYRNSGGGGSYSSYSGGSSGSNPPGGPDDDASNNYYNNQIIELLGGNGWGSSPKKPKKGK